MATQLFLLDTAPDVHLGTDSVRLTGTATGWTSRALGTARGSGVVAVAATQSVAGATVGVELGWSGANVTREWISPPLAADVTIAGTITANIWASESSMSANVAINVVVDVIRANATGTRNSNTVVEIARSTNTVELALTTRTANNFTVTPTSTAANRGDRLRVRVFGDDSAAATMASGFSFDGSYNGTTAAADGDSYVSFTETFAFESATPGVLQQSARDSEHAVGSSTTAQREAQPFAAASATLTEVRVWLRTTGAPTDDAVVEIQTDSAGSPSGSVVATVATVAGTSLNTTMTEYTYSTSIALTASTTYWLVVRRSGAVDAVNFYNVGINNAGGAGWTSLKTFASGSWTAALGGAFTVKLTFAVPTPTTLYLTDTASAVATASVDREAWTSRGAGVQNDVTNTAAGYTAPIQVTDTAGGTVVDWFTRPLTAFTLGGMAVANLRLAASATSARLEIARVDNDGTNATVWGSWCIAPVTTDGGLLIASEVARTANLSGDDLAISDGQRLRIRVSIDDPANAAMVTGRTVTLYYAGTSAAASGDSYVTFPQTLTEYTAPGGTTVIPVGFAVGRDY